MRVEGIDLSVHNGQVDWAKIAEAKIRFAILKVNEGDLIDPTTTRTRIADARKHGVRVGGYDFLRPRAGRTGAQEFDIFWARCRSVGLDDPRSLLPVADVEATALGRDETRAYIRSWVQRCVEITGRRPIIYTGHFWRETLGNWPDSLRCPLWLAAYTTSPTGWVPNAWSKVTIWQYTETGRVPGVSGRVDRNCLMAGTLDDLTLKDRPTPRPADPRYRLLTDRERQHVDELLARRRVAHRHGGWSKVSVLHNVRATAAKAWLTARLLQIAAGSSSNRPQRRAYLRKVVRNPTVRTP